jgi:hypothetical protein
MASSPLPLGERVASEAPPERGNLQIQVATPLPPSLGYRLREGTLSLKGRGEE